jgi:molecular chaperone HtpG
MGDALDNRYYTFEEYRAATEALQTDKDNKLVVLYTSDPVQQNSYIKAAVGKGYKVVKLDTLIDPNFINQIEAKQENMRFTRVDADIADNLISQEEKPASVLSQDQENMLKELFGKQIPDPAIKIDLKGLSEDTAPIVATRSEMSRRMKDMAAMGGPSMSWYAAMPDEVNLTVNTNHPIYRQILEEKNADRQGKVIHNLADLALLSQGMLKGEGLTDFMNRSIELMEGKTASKIITAP